LLCCCPLKQVLGRNALLATCLDDIYEHVIEDADVTHRTLRAPVALEHVGGAVVDESGAARRGSKGPTKLAPRSWLGFFTPR
jgi:hypothetical protein